MGALDTLNGTNASGEATNIATGAVQSGDLATDSVGTGAIIDANVTAAKLASGVVNNNTITVTAGDALTGGGTFTVNQNADSTITINHEDTSSQDSSDNSGSTFIQDITLDTYGHVTGIGTATAGGSGVGTDVGVNGVGSMCLMSIFTSVTVNSGSTTGGGNLVHTVFDSSGLSVTGPLSTGTWRNITGKTLSTARRTGTFQRIS